MLTRLISVLVLLLVAACGGAGPVRYAAPEVPVQARVSIPHRTVAVREVSLPSYATEEIIAVADGKGGIRESADKIWADDPTRAVTLEVTSALGMITGRTVAADPWPFRDDPDAVVDIRLEEFVADERGAFTARGQFYIAHSDENRRDRSQRFRIVERFDPEGGFPAIAAARSRAVNALALRVARDGLR
jgi:uncharacterized lipoprotein YmbA